MKYRAFTNCPKCKKMNWRMYPGDGACVLVCVECGNRYEDKNLFRILEIIHKQLKGIE